MRLDSCLHAVCIGVALGTREYKNKYLCGRGRTRTDERSAENIFYRANASRVVIKIAAIDDSEKDNR